jgi:hypothetical protein
MKKVYGSVKIGIFTCAPFLLFLDAFLHDQASFFAKPKWFLVGFAFLIIFVGSIYLSLKSFWAYGEKGIEISNFNGECKKKYGWSDVSQVGLFGVGYRQHWPFLEMKDGRQIWVNVFMTRNYFSVLSDVVKYVRNKCPETYIEPHISKLVEKGRWHFL